MQRGHQEVVGAETPQMDISHDDSRSGTDRNIEAFNGEPQLSGNALDLIGKQRMSKAVLGQGGV